MWKYVTTKVGNIKDPQGSVKKLDTSDIGDTDRRVELRKCTRE